MTSMLEQLNIQYKPEFVINGANYRYDFYLVDYNVIIEMHGRQHYEPWKKSGKTLEEIQENDSQKYEWALENNINHYVVIDSKNSSVSYIKKNIIDSILSSLICFDNINWDTVAYNSFQSLIHITIEHYNNGKTPNEIASILKKSPTTIYKWLRKGESSGLCVFERSKGFLYDEKPVILVNTKQIYPSISEAARSTGENAQNISAVCNHDRKYCGLRDNKPVIWMFLEEYNGENYEDFEIFLSHHRGIRVHKYTLDGAYLESYESITRAKEITGITTIINVCSKRKYSTGGFRWYYADDKMQPDKTKIIGIPRYYGEDKIYSAKAGK